MAATITLENLVNGQDVLLPYEVRGTAAGVSPPATNVVALARQVDNNPLRDMADECIPAVPPAAATTDFAFELTGAECPQAGSWYLLNVYAWDDRDDVTTTSVTFRVAAPVLDPEPVPEVPCA